MRDIRAESTAADHVAAHAEAASGTTSPVDIRLAMPEDAEQLARLFYRAYGDSYDYEWVYRPDALRQRWLDGTMVSVVGIDPGEIVVGHLGANFDRPGATVGESGQAVVEPRYRGHHLFESIKTWAARWAEREGLYGLFSEATAVHPYSQRGNLTLGAHEMGFMVGYIPNGVDYKSIRGAPVTHRATAALMYLRTSAEPERVAHVPAPYRDVVERVWANAALRRRVGDGLGAHLPSRTELHLRRYPEHNAAQLHCKDAGSDMHQAVAKQLAVLREEGVDCVYLDLPLADPDVYLHGADLDGLGFAFSCILPELREDGDVLRLQHLNGVELHVEEIATASDFGRCLLEEIVAGLTA